MDEEPSVLDYVKDKLAFWRPSRLHLPAREGEPVQVEEPAMSGTVLYRTEEETETVEPEFDAEEEPALEPVPAPRSQVPFGLLGLGAALVAQFLLEPVSRADPGKVRLGILLYGVAAVLMGVAYFRRQWILAPPRADAKEKRMSLSIGDDPLMAVLQVVVCILLAMVAFYFFGDKTTGVYDFNLLNVAVWLLSVFFFLRTFWIPEGKWLRFWKRARALVTRPVWNVVINRWTLLVLLVAALAFFFKFYQLNQVPPEMVSDHAEKLLDVSDVLAGQLHIYFPRNTGREALQFYLTVAVIQIFQTGVTFLSLKIGTAIAALATLPFIYLLGKEVGNRWVGLFAALFAGISYWANMFTRIALRFTLYPLFVAPTLYYLVRGLRRRSRNDMVLSGIFLGIGLHGYTSIRILPFLVVLGVILYGIHAQSKGNRKEAIFGLVLLGSAAFLLFLPLFRYAVDNPEMFGFRTLSRIGGIEQPLPGPPLQIFLDNLWKASIMFWWDDGEIWVHSVTHRPALDLISAVLFFSGVVLLLVRYVQRRHWVDLFLIFSVPVLMLPSILSLAFPGENPSLNRTSGAIVPVFVILGIGLDGLLTGLRSTMGRKAGTRFAVALTVFFVVFSSLQNFDLVFNQYQKVYLQNSWNTSEIGTVIRGFADSIGNKDSAWVVGYPYWVDTRLVGINAGYPTKDYAIWPQQIPDTLADPRAKLFVLNLQDAAGLAALRTTYPQGVLSVYHSQVSGKDFYLYTVLPAFSTAQ
ncbi:MAG TPA: glycosyltransferase family 39 protein [Anaerolineaceae bacterium]|nr:glycosyltransferase family 39 protein [Anaerolineaceae bacterium]